MLQNSQVHTRITAEGKSDSEWLGNRGTQTERWELRALENGESGRTESAGELRALENGESGRTESAGELRALEN